MLSAFSMDRLKGGKKEPVAATVSVVTGESITEAEDASDRLDIARAMTSEELHRESQRVRRRIDRYLLGTTWVMFVFNHLDRISIANARLDGLEQSLHINPIQYAAAIALLFVGYITMQIPSNILLARARPSIYLPSCMLVLGVISIATAFVHNARDLFLVRFLLGCVEAGFCVGALFLISCWYTRGEMGFRSAVLLSAPLFGYAFSGLFAAAVTSGLDGVGALESWRWLFLVGGIGTAVVAVASFFLLPDFPSNTRWLSTRERAVAEYWLKLDAGQSDEDDPGWKQGLKMVVKDIRVYVFAAMFGLLSVGASAHNFLPSLVETLGYGQIHTLLLTVPPYLIAICIALVNNWSADRSRNSSFHVIWPLGVAVAGFVVASATLNPGARYFALVLVISCGHGVNAVVLAWTQKTVLRPRIKRAIALAFVNSHGSVAQMSTSFLYPRDSAPRYTMSMAVSGSCVVAAMLLALMMRIMLQRANKVLERREHGTAATSLPSESQGLDTPDVLEHDTARLSFRYIT